MAGQNVPLILLEKPKKVHINALVNSVYKSFQSIEPWYRAEMIERGLPQATLGRIVAQGDKYLVAIREVIQAVGDEATFIKDIMTLCPEEGQPIKHAEPSESTLHIAETAYRDTSQTCEQLRSIRKAFSEIIQRVGSYMTNKLSKTEKNAQTAIIRLPKSLTDDELSKGKEIIEVTLSGREMERKTAEEVMEQLGIAEKNILELATQVDEFMAWWNWARLSLRNMQPQDGTNRRRVPDILNRWKTILAQYEKHTDRIDAIRSWSKAKSLIGSAATSTSTHDPLRNQPSAHASSKPNNMEESKKTANLTVDKALEISVANLTPQSGSQPIHIRLVSRAVLIALNIGQCVKGTTNADDLKRIATDACNLMYVVLGFFAEQRRNGRKMPKDSDGNLQDLVDTLVDINTSVQNFVLQPEASLSDADVKTINKHHERIIQLLRMFSL